MSYSDNVNPGYVKVTIRGINLFDGELTTGFYIYKGGLEGAHSTVGTQYYTGSEVKPVPEVYYDLPDPANPEQKITEKLVYGQDFECYWINNTEVSYHPEKNLCPPDYYYFLDWETKKWSGEVPPHPCVVIHGKGDYVGTQYMQFIIAKAWLKDAEITVPDQEYTGAALTPKPVVVFNGTTLAEGVDYRIAGYSDNVEASDTKPTVILEGIGRFNGRPSVKFKITKKEEPPVRVSSVSLNKTSAKMLANKTLTLKATVAPSNAANKAVTWTSSDKTIATVSSTGKVTGKKGGKVTITATTADGKKTATCEIQVLNKIRVPLQDGKYYLFTSKLGNFCMTVPDKSKKAGTSLVLIKQNLSGWQKFKVKKVIKDGGEYYALINKNSGLAVTWENFDFVQRKYTGSNSQLFFAMRYGDNSLQLINKRTNRAIGIPGKKAARRANVGPVKFGAGLEQRWINAVSAE